MRRASFYPLSLLLTFAVCVPTLFFPISLWNVLLNLSLRISADFAEIKILKHDIVVEGYTPTVEYWWGPYDNDRSLFMYPRDHPTREMCIRIAESEFFDNFILFCIALSTVLIEASLVNLFHHPPQKSPKWTSVDIVSSSSSF